MSKNQELSKLVRCIKKNSSILLDSIGLTLGPKGFEIFVKDEKGTGYVPSDLISYLIDYPSGTILTNFLIEIIQEQNIEKGDSSKTAAIYALAFLKTFQKLINSRIPLSKILSMLDFIKETSLTILEETRYKFFPNPQTVNEFTKTAFTSEIGYRYREYLAELCSQTQSLNFKSFDKVRIFKIFGAEIEDSELIFDCIIIPHGSSKGGTPKLTYIENALIGLINFSLNNIESEFNVSSHIDICESIYKSGCNVVLVKKFHSGSVIHYKAVKYLNDKNIMVVLNITDEEEIYIREITGKESVSDISFFNRSSMFSAEIVEEMSTEENIYIKITGLYKKFNFASIILKAPTEYMMEEIYKALHKGLLFRMNLLENESVVAGGGSLETFIAHRLIKLSTSMPKLDAFCIKTFSKYIKKLLKYLITSVKANERDINFELKKNIGNGNTHFGFDVERKIVCDMIKERVVLPSSTIKHAFILAFQKVKSFIEQYDDEWESTYF